MGRWWQLWVAVLFSFGLSASAQEVAPAAGLFPLTAKSVDSGSKEPWRFLLYLPRRYFQKPEEKLPLLLFLHGSSGRGKDLEIVKRYGPPARLKSEADFPMVMVAPQLPGGGWEAASVLALLDEVLATYRIDPDRVYLTGVSLGGQGSWGVAAQAPERFAAFAPVCGYGDARSAPRFTKLPVWAFHGAMDDIVPLAPHQQLVEAVNQAGGAAKLTIYEQGDHGNIIAPIYGRESGSRLYTWLLSHRRGQSAPALPVEERLERLPGPGAPTPPKPPAPAPEPPVPPASTSTSTSTPRPGEFWDLLFRLLDGDAPQPEPKPASEGAQVGAGATVP